MMAAFAIVQACPPWNSAFSQEVDLARSISGRIIDENGNSIAEARIEATPLMNGINGVRFQTHSGETGTFIFEDLLASGDYLLECWSAGFEYRNAGRFLSGKTDAVITLQPVPLQTRTGQVLQAGTNTPVEGARVVLIGQHIYKRTVISDQEGRFIFDDVPETIGQGIIYAAKGDQRSEYKRIYRLRTESELIEASQPGRGRGFSRPVPVATSARRLNNGEIALELTVPARIEGKAFSLTGSKRVSDALVAATPWFSNGFVVETQTDENGDYTFEALPAGEYLISVTHPEWFRPERYAPRTHGRLQPLFDIFEKWFPPIEFTESMEARIEALAGTSTVNNVAMLEKATVLGKVVDPDQQPISNAVISTKSSKGPYGANFYDTVRTDKEGRFKIHTSLIGEAQDGPAVISSAAEIFGTTSIEIANLQEGDEMEVDIQFNGIMTISGYVKDPSENPVSEVSVSVLHGLGSDKTDATGYFELNTFPLPAPPGEEFHVQFFAPRPGRRTAENKEIIFLQPGRPVPPTSATRTAALPLPSPDTQFYLHKIETVTSEHKGHLELDVVLTPAEQLRISGQVTDSMGRPVDQARLTLYAGNVPEEEWQYDIHPETLGGNLRFFSVDITQHIGVAATVTDENGRYTFVTVRESTGRLILGSFSKLIDPSTYSIGIETQNGESRLIHDIFLPNEETQKLVDVTLDSITN